jgi:predicted  nucleic acid-binding Zn ribbon protein
MYIVEAFILRVTCPTPITDEIEEAELWAIDLWLSALRTHGQVAGSEFPTVSIPEGYRVFLMLPFEDSLEPRHNSEYVNGGLHWLADAGLHPPQVNMLGPSDTGSAPCGCQEKSWLILQTDHVSLESPLRCGDCYGTVPLYCIPKIADNTRDFHDKMRTWISDFQACDGLQMRCSTGERFGIREISQHDSSLSLRGRWLCQQITQYFGIPCYYFLFRYGGRSYKREKARLCPSCGGEWVLGEELHEQFHFKCDRCCLISEISISVLSEIAVKNRSLP